MDTGRNQSIKRELRALGIPYWRIAEKIGVSELTVLRWLRVELSAERLEAFRAAIAEIQQEGRFICG